MSLASTASVWINDNSNNQTKKRIPSIRRTTAKVRPSNIDESQENYSNEEIDISRDYNTHTMENTEKVNEDNTNRVNKLINALSSENSGNKLADFQPISQPSINSMRQSVNDSNSYTKTSFDDLMPKNLQHHRPDFASNDSNLTKLSNYNQTYSGNISYQPSYAKIGLGNSSLPLDEKLTEKINYMIHLLEQQQSEKTANITEEFILYTFLGVFVIYVLDSFTRAGRYVR